MSGIFQDFFGVLKTFGIIDLIDIIAVAFIIYYAIMLAKETRAMQLVKSIGVILLVYFIATNLNMSALEFLLKKVLDIGIIVLVVLFQPELRRALERIGRSKFTEFGKRGLSITETEEAKRMVREICNACDTLIKRGEGAIIVVERQIKLGEVISTGTLIDAEVSALLISNIFYDKSPLHDGAMIMRDYRIYAAGCYLPLSDNIEIAQEMGTRHRAGVGISEISDAITIIISEERGVASIAYDGKIKTAMNTKKLRSELEKHLIEVPEKEKLFKGWRK